MLVQVSCSTLSVPAVGVAVASAGACRGVAGQADAPVHWSVLWAVGGALVGGQAAHAHDAVPVVVVDVIPVR
jgi:hypothetical protein